MKRKRKPAETALERYDWSRARRGHWAGRLRTPKAVFLRPEIYAAFGSDEAVNAALEAIVAGHGKARGPVRRRRRAA
jgi:hypothetical protein